jgi:uncharacterized membrane protein YfcA
VPAARAPEEPPHAEEDRAAVDMPHLIPELSLPSLVALGAIVLLAYTVFGATGFGSAIVAVPLLAHLLPLATTVALVTSLDVFASTGTAWRQRRHVEWPEFKRLAPVQLVGMAIGATLLVNLPPGPALLALGVFVTVYGTYVLAGARRLRRAPAWLVFPIGLVGGVFSALFGTGGPIYVMYLSARIADKSALRATSAVMVTLSVAVRIVLFVIAGLLLDTRLLLLIAGLVPAMALGVFLGHRLHARLSSAGVLRLIAALLVVNGVSLLVRVLA